MKRFLTILLLASTPAIAVDVTITIPDEYATRVLDAVASHYDYKDTIDGVPNPETKVQFVKRQVLQILKGITINQEMLIESRASQTTKRTELGL